MPLHPLSVNGKNLFSNHNILIMMVGVATICFSIYFYTWFYFFSIFPYLVLGDIQFWQKLCRPLLFLSVTSALSELSERDYRTNNAVDDSPTESESTEEPSTIDIG